VNQSRKNTLPQLIATERITFWLSQTPQRVGFKGIVRRQPWGKNGDNQQKAQSGNAQPTGNGHAFDQSLHAPGFLSISSRIRGFIQA
jgi:hypothetical protein